LKVAPIFDTPLEESIAVNIELDQQGVVVEPSLISWTSPKALSPLGNKVLIEVNGFENLVWASVSIGTESFNLKVDKTLVSKSLKEAKG